MIIIEFNKKFLVEVPDYQIVIILMLKLRY